MAVKKDEIKKVVKKNPTRQKVVVEQGRSMGNPYIPYKVLHTEVVADKEEAKKRVEELKKEYEGVDALSVNYFSL